MEIEYGKLAKFYDLFYSSKSYSNELIFLKEILEDRNNILDAGCGTGNHMKLLEDNGYNVTGFDLSKDMLDVAKNKVHGKLNTGNILTYKDNNKYDAIISMFAVFNHLKDYNEFKTAINNLLDSLNPNGVLIIDLHNGHKDGYKIDKYENIKRIMKWNIKNNSEHTDIVYQINNEEYKTSHDFIIYQIDKINKVLKDMDYKIFENYTFINATDESKNLQIVIKK